MKQASVSSAAQSGGKRRAPQRRQNAPPATPEAARGLLRALVVHAQQLFSSTSRAFVAWRAASNVAKLPELLRRQQPNRI
jgi:hypothetical protein